MDRGASADPRVDVGSRTYRRALIALFCAGVATFAQMYSPQALLPQIADEFGVTAGTASWVIGATTIGVAVGVVPWARLSDRLGRATAMRTAISLAVAIGLLVAAMPIFPALLLVRAVEGLVLAGLPALAVTTLAETVRPRALPAAVGSYVAGTTIGGLLGRVLAGSVGEVFGWRGGMIAVVAVALCAAVVFLFLLPQTRVSPAPAMPLGAGLRDNLRRPGVLALVVQGFLTMGAMVAAYNAVSFRLQQPPFDLSLSQASWIYLAYLAGALASGQAWRITRRFGATPALTMWVALMAVGAVVSLADALIAVVLGLVLITAGFFGTHAVSNGLIDARAGAGRSLAPSLYNWGLYGGSSVLGWAGGAAFVAVGWSGTASLVFVAAIVAIAVAWLFERSVNGSRPMSAETG